MIYLTTGANGAGKTLNTLELVRSKQVAEGRSVYYDGFDMRPEKAAEFGWQKFDPLKWQDLPDGSILIFDECHKAFPLRGSGAAVPPYVQAIAEHRKRGFDFFLVTQHPLNLDKFILRNIGDPGWHRHLKRTFGADMVSVSQWSAVVSNCEKPGASKSAKVSMVPFPKHVYQWYDSAVLHTAKRQIPRQVYILGALLVAIPVVFYTGFTMVGKKSATAPAGASSSAAPAGTAPASGPPDYFTGYAPRIAGLPHTAPRFDDVTKPTTAPFPAACVRMAARCSCYTQQGTALDTPADLCLQIVKGGYFQEWGAPAPVGSGATPASPARIAAPAASPAAAPAPVAVPAAVRDGETVAFLREAARATH